MANIYWTREVKKIMDDKIHEITDDLIADEESCPDMDAEIVSRIRAFRYFADEIIRHMEELDRKYDEEQLARKVAAEKEAKDEQPA